MALVIFIGIILVVLIILSGNGDKVMKELEEDKKNELLRHGYHYMKSNLVIKYVGGLKGISKDISVFCELTLEGILFYYYKLPDDLREKKDILSEEEYNTYIDMNKKQYILIEWDKILDVNLETEKHIQEKLKLGNMILFGAFAFAMDKKIKTTEKEYVVLLVRGENEEYNIIIESVDRNQELYDLINKNKKGIVQRIDNESTNDDVYANLNKLKELKDNGILTEKEFEDKKRILLDKIN